MTSITFDALALARRLREVSGLATKTDIAELKAGLLKWMFTTALAQVGAVVALLKLLG